MVNKYAVKYPLYKIGKYSSDSYSIFQFNLLMIYMTGFFATKTASVNFPGALPKFCFHILGLYIDDLSKLQYILDFSLWAIYRVTTPSYNEYGECLLSASDFLTYIDSPAGGEALQWGLSLQQQAN